MYISKVTTGRSTWNTPLSFQVPLTKTLPAATEKDFNSRVVEANTIAGCHYCHHFASWAVSDTIDVGLQGLQLTADLMMSRGVVLLHNIYCSATILAKL